MRVDVYTYKLEVADYIKKRFNKEYIEDPGLEKRDKVLWYHILDINYKSLKHLLDRVNILGKSLKEWCEIYNSKTNKLMWPKRSNKELEERLGL